MCAVYYFLFCISVFNALALKSKDSQLLVLVDRSLASSMEMTLGNFGIKVFGVTWFVTRARGPDENRICSILTSRHLRCSSAFDIWLAMPTDIEYELCIASNKSLNGKPLYRYLVRRKVKYEKTHSHINILKNDVASKLDTCDIALLSSSEATV